MYVCSNTVCKNNLEGNLHRIVYLCKLDRRSKILRPTNICIYLSKCFLILFVFSKLCFFRHKCLSTVFPKISVSLKYKLEYMWGYFSAHKNDKRGGDSPTGLAEIYGIRFRGTFLRERFLEENIVTKSLKMFSGLFFLIQRKYCKEV